MRMLLTFCAAVAIPCSLHADDAAPGVAKSSEPSTQATADSFCVVGYLPNWETKRFDPAIGKQLTDVIYFSVEPTADGDLNHRNLEPAVIEQLHKMRDEHHTRIEVAVGGWGRAKAMGPVALDAAKRKRFIEALAKYCDENKLDGVDFDWEFPRGKDETAAFGTLLKESKAALAPAHRLLTIAVSPSQKLPPEAIEAVDRVHLMSYDHGGPSHSSFDQAEADVKQVLGRGVPKSKLVLGVPFYGRNPGGSPNEMSYSRIIAQFHPAADVDTAGKFSFNSVATIRKKAKLAADQQLGGLMIWEIGQDTRDDSSLLRAIQDEREKK